MTQHSILKQRLVAAAMEAGAHKVGFAHAVEVDADNLGYYQRWIAAGNNGGMGYLETTRLSAATRENSWKTRRHTQ